MITLDLITISYNSCKHLQRCLDSVRNNSSSINKYIVIDGGSSDGTIELIKNNLDIISEYISEPDGGISDAFNKGLIRCNADFILILNSDDWLIEDSLSGVCKQISLDDEIVFTPMASFLGDVGQGFFTSNPDLMSKFNSVLHPGCIVSSKVYNKIGLYDTSLNIAMDYDFFSRCFESGIKYRQIDLPIVAFQEGGASRQHKYRILVESFKIRRKYYGSIFPVRELFRYVSRFSGDILESLGLKILAKKIISRITLQ